MGFDVAYLSELGKFDGLESEVSGKYGSHASFYICRFKSNVKLSCWRSVRVMGGNSLEWHAL